MKPYLLLLPLGIIIWGCSRNHDSTELITKNVPSQIKFASAVYIADFQLSPGGPMKYLGAATVKDSSGGAVKDDLVIYSIYLRNGTTDLASNAFIKRLPSSQDYTRATGTGFFGDLGKAGTEYEVIVTFAGAWMNYLQLNAGKVVVPGNG